MMNFMFSSLFDMFLWRYLYTSLAKYSRHAWSPFGANIAETTILGSHDVADVSFS